MRISASQVGTLSGIGLAVIGVGALVPRVLGWVLIVTGVLLFLLPPGVFALQRRRCLGFWWRTRLHARRTPGVSASLGLVVVRAAPTSSRDLRFATNRQERQFISTGDENPPPVAISFRAPMQHLVSTPMTDVRHCGRRVLRVEQFHESGFVISQQLPGVEIEAEIAYED